MNANPLTPGTGEEYPKSKPMTLPSDLTALRERLNELSEKALQSFSMETRRDITDEYVSCIMGCHPKTYLPVFITQCDGKVSDETFELIIELRNAWPEISSALTRLEAAESLVQQQAEQIDMLTRHNARYRRSTLNLAELVLPKSYASEANDIVAELDSELIQFKNEIETKYNTQNGNQQRNIEAGEPRDGNSSRDGNPD